MTALQRQPNTRIAVFFWEGYLGVSPSLINALRLLAQQNYQVDVFMQYNFCGFPDAPQLDAKVRLHRCYTVGAYIRTWLPESVQSVEWLPIGNPLSDSNSSLLKKMTRTAKELSYWACWIVDHLMFTAFALFRTLPHQYICFIGVDRDGLLGATIIGFAKGIQTVCWSLEIRSLRDSRSCFQRLAKRLETKCLQGVAKTITQDQFRAEALAKENAIDLSRIITVPNSPIGPPPLIKEKDYLQRRLAIPKSVSAIVLHLGEIGPELLSLELAKTTVDWPSECLLVFHERRIRSRESGYLRAIEQAGAGRVLISLAPVSYDDLDRLVSSGKIGVLLYRSDLGLNFTLAGASGKLAHYLRCGLPVVSLDLPGVAQVLEKFSCGICVKSVDEMGEAIWRILMRYERYSSNAIKCYRENYEFGAHFEKVLQVIGSLRK
jgi:glycosyltransferase involved in cell wall biosynthesis